MCGGYPTKWVKDTPSSDLAEVFVTLDALQRPRFKRKLEVLFGEYFKFTIKGENVSSYTAGRVTLLVG